MIEQTFRLPESRGIIRFIPDVLKHIYNHAQTNFWKKEAGGQLFSNAPESKDIPITIATGPYATDKRTRCGFYLDVNIANRDRQEKFSCGYHAIGLWHTHPENNPFPSGRDRQTACEYLKAFNGEMEGFLMVIVGNRGNPPNLCVWMASINRHMPWIRLDEL